MLYSATQALLSFCMTTNISIEMKVNELKGFILKISFPSQMIKAKSFSYIKPKNEVWIGNGYNDHYSYATQFNDPENPNVCTGLAAETGILTLELVCRELLDIITDTEGFFPKEIVLMDNSYMGPYFDCKQTVNQYEDEEMLKVAHKLNNLYFLHVAEYVQRTPLDSIRAEYQTLKRHPFTCD